MTRFGEVRSGNSDSRVRGRRKAAGVCCESQAGLLGLLGWEGGAEGLALWITQDGERITLPMP